jgi:hypothetical protein
MEPVRPQIDSYLLNWISRTPLRRDWFFEQCDGNCRLTNSLAIQLCGTSHMWASAVAPWAEFIARSLWSKTRSGNGRRAPATRLTGDHRREGRGGAHARPVPRAPQVPTLCRQCGKAIPPGNTRCGVCASIHSKGVFDQGRLVAQTLESRARRSSSQKIHAIANRAWSPSAEFAWLDKQTYLGKIQPLLATVSISGLRSALSVSEPYAAFIRSGVRVPHPRHWPTLAQLVGISSTSS